jgi:HAD superfamily hydrolase (TIGR01509 family)
MTVATDVRGVILDVDGTLVDSNDAHAQAWIEALAEAGHQVPFERVRRLIGMGGDNLLPELIGLEEDTPEGQRLSTRRGEIFKDRYLRTLRPFPGARALLERMRADGLDLVVASSAQADELEALLDVAEAKELLEDTTSSGDVERSKPEPDIVGVALRKLGHSAEAVMMLGDTPYDIEAAANVGVRTVAVRCGGWDDRDLDGVAAIYDDPADLLLHYDESPLAPGRR